ncbi:TPA: hypothetical protein NHP34_006063 [Pseudomonas aeruginosa]|nr:hypothetical protein [Pseudomonas aeruginosa]
MTTREHDHALEAKILELGLCAPRVTVQQIDALVDGLTYHTYVVPGTTTTVAAAIGPGSAVVALAFSATASADNFNEVTGRNQAIAKAKEKARSKLWELEGWRLKLNLLDLSEAGLLDQVLDVELLDVGTEWPSAAVPAAVLRSAGALPSAPRACPACPGKPACPCPRPSPQAV